MWRYKRLRVASFGLVRRAVKLGHFFGCRFTLSKTVHFVNSTTNLLHQTLSRNRKPATATRVAGPWELAPLLLRSWTVPIHCADGIAVTISINNPYLKVFAKLFSKSVPSLLPDALNYSIPAKKANKATERRFKEPQTVAYDWSIKRMTSTR